MKKFLLGVRDGIPIALGYFAVSITLGVAAANAGLTIFQAVIASLTNNASAGEFVGFSLIAATASYIELILMEGLANARYLLMSVALSQKLTSDIAIWKRILLSFCVTDEIFGISVNYGNTLNPLYSYGAFAIACPAWAAGTFLGAFLGSVLPLRAVSALSVGLYGMFIAIFTPPARKEPFIGLCILVSFALSFAFTYLPAVSSIPAGFRTILLTVSISLGAAILHPVSEKGEMHRA